MLNWIFFDVGSTLVDETAAYQRFAHRCAMTLASHGKQVTGAEFFAKMQEVAALGEAPIRNAWAWYGLPDELRPRWSHEGETLYPDVLQTLEYLSQSYSLGIIANQAAAVLNRSGFEAYSVNGTHFDWRRETK